LETVEVFDLVSVSEGSNGTGGGGSFATLASVSKPPLVRNSLMLVDFGCGVGGTIVAVSWTRAGQYNGVTEVPFFPTLPRKALKTLG